MAVTVPSVCEDCGWPMVEDLQVAIDAMLFTPKLTIRQWRCKQGHSITITSRRVLPVPTFRVVCDMCLEPFLAVRENTRRHAGCEAEFERRRKRKYPGRLTGAVEAGCNGR